MKDSPTEDFIIDQTLGRDVKFTLDDFPGSGKITGIQLLSSDGTVLESSSGPIGSTWSTTIERLEVRCSHIIFDPLQTNCLGVIFKITDAKSC